MQGTKRPAHVPENLRSVGRFWGSATKDDEANGDEGERGTAGLVAQGGGEG